MDLTGAWRGCGPLWGLWSSSDKPGMERDLTGVWGHDTWGRVQPEVGSLAGQEDQVGCGPDKARRCLQCGGGGGSVHAIGEGKGRRCGRLMVGFIRLSLRRYSKTPPQCTCLYANLTSRSHCLSGLWVLRLVCSVTSDSSLLGGLTPHDPDVV